MRDPKRIRKICDLICVFWTRNSDLRFWQVISIIVGALPKEKQNRDPFFFEDDIWEEAIKNAGKHTPFG